MTAWGYIWFRVKPHLIIIKSQKSSAANFQSLQQNTGCSPCTMTKKISKAAKNQVLWFSNAKQSYSAFFVSILMYSNKVPRTFFNTWKLRLFSWSNSSILRNKEKVRHIKKLPIFWNSKICMDYNAKHHKKSEKTQN